MLKNVPFIIFMAIFAVGNQACGTDIPKSDWASQFVYNYFYDCDCYDNRVDSIKSTLGMEIDRNGREVASIQETSFYRYPFMDCIEFDGGHPYIWLRVKWSGTREELCKHVLLATSSWHDMFNVYIKLEYMPKLANDKRIDSINMCQKLHSRYEVISQAPKRKPGSIKIILTDIEKDFSAEICFLAKVVGEAGARYVYDFEKNLNSLVGDTILIEDILNGDYSLDVRLNDEECYNYLITNIPVGSGKVSQIEVSINNKRSGLAGCYKFLKWDELVPEDR